MTPRKDPEMKPAYIQSDQRCFELSQVLSHWLEGGNIFTNQIFEAAEQLKDTGNLRRELAKLKQEIGELRG